LTLSALIVPDLSIIIVNYNTREALRRCLDSIQREHDGLDVEVIVVDNASRDGSAAMVRERPEVRLIEPGYNTWFTGGNNLGLAQATGEYALILNPDTVIQPGALATMLDYLRSNPSVGAITCQMRYPDGRRQYTCSRLPTYLDLVLNYTFLGVLLAPWRRRRRAWLWYEGWDRQSTRAVELIPDSCLMAPLGLLRQIGAFDEALKLYFTEDDICKRILNSGHAIHFVAEAVIVHEERASTSQVQRLASQVYFADLVVFSRKYFGGARTALLRLLILPTVWGMDVVQRLRGERGSL
jgi:GT2 family glycosyltransferase